MCNKDIHLTLYSIKLEGTVAVPLTVRSCCRTINQTYWLDILVKLGTSLISFKIYSKEFKNLRIEKWILAN